MSKLSKCVSAFEITGSVGSNHPASIFNALVAQRTWVSFYNLNVELLFGPTVGFNHNLQSVCFDSLNESTHCSYLSDQFQCKQIKICDSLQVAPNKTSLSQVSPPRGRYKAV